MGCTYCDCPRPVEKELGGFPYCKKCYEWIVNNPNFNKGIDRPIGHFSIYEGENNRASRTLIGDLAMSAGYKFSNPINWE